MKSALTRLQETIEARSDLVLQLNGDLTKANLIIKERQKDLDKVHSEVGLYLPFHEFTCLD